MLKKFCPQNSSKWWVFSHKFSIFQMGREFFDSPKFGGGLLFLPSRYCVHCNMEYTGNCLHYSLNVFHSFLDSWFLLSFLILLFSLMI